MYTLSPLEYLDALLVDYTLIPHEHRFTAQETAQVAHIKGSELSKVIVLGDQFSMLMAVIPAHHLIEASRLAYLLRIPNLDIVSEKQFAEKFPECELGAMPPFGKLYRMDVYLAKELAAKEFIIFNGGSHSLLVKMRTAEFIRLSSARIIGLGYRPCAELENQAANDAIRQYRA